MKIRLMLQLLIAYKSKRAQGGVSLPPKSDEKVQRGKVAEWEESNQGCCPLPTPPLVFLLNPGVIKHLSNVTVLWKDGIILSERVRQRWTETEKERADLTMSLILIATQSLLGEPLPEM